MSRDLWAFWMCFNGLVGLGHEAVIGGHHEDRNVCGRLAPRARILLKGGMPRGVRGR